jgi:hypothetical protein
MMKPAWIPRAVTRAVGGLVLAVASLAAQTPAAPDPAKAQEILRAVGEAIGEEKAAGLKSLTAKGEYRRVMGQTEMTGELEWRLLLPDRFQRIEYLERPDGTPAGTMTATLDGDDAWRDVQQGGGMFIMRREPGETGEGGGPGGRGGDGAPRRFNAARGIRADYYRTLLGLLPGVPALSSSFTATYAGQAQAANGQTADIIDFNGRDDFKARLFVDSASHLPLMLSYQGPDLSRFQRVIRGEPPATEEERRKRREEMRKQMEAQGPPQMVEMQWFFSDHRSVDGVTLPHHFSHQVNGQVQEELTIKEYDVNPDLKLEQFKNKKKNDGSAEGA